MERSGSAGSAVVAIECVAGSSRADEWGGCKGEAAAPLRMGDILEEITFGGSPPARAPFKGDRDAVMKLLHAAFQRGRRLCPRAGPPWRALRRAVTSISTPASSPTRLRTAGSSSSAPSATLNRQAIIDRPRRPIRFRVHHITRITEIEGGLRASQRTAEGKATSRSHGRGRVVFHLRIVCNARRQRRGISSSNETEGALQKSGDGVEAPRRLTDREREGASLDGLHLGRHQLLRHRLPQPEALAAPARTETHSASLVHVGRVCVRRSTSSLLWRNPEQGWWSDGAATTFHVEASVGRGGPSVAPPSPADEVSSDAMIRYSNASSD
ncbi:hypothetical protein OPV22_014517 [Ensete ventricosum]|uniref:Uncharacterized protein n=1 Tax=Ensete ventricosum TaxID=4639 RepID=A0AAV8RC28_ENSVE|nr:hypothetical protein OPV22_014517 [Ensete ventricosum]